MNKFKNIGIFLFIILTACQNNNFKENLNDNINININDIPQSAFLKYSDLFDSVKFVKLETKNECLIGRVDKILLYQGKIFILDQVQSKSVFVFDYSGKFLNKIGRKGKGPGEFDEPNDIAIDKYTENIIIYNNSKKSLLFFDFNGNYKHSIELKFFIKSIEVIDKDVYAVYLDLGNDNPQYANNMLIINGESEILNEVFPISNQPSSERGGFNFFRKYANELLISPGFSNKIFSVFKDSVCLKYTIDFGKHNTPSELFGKPKNEFDQALKTSSYAQLLNYQETPNYLILNFVFKKLVYTGFYSKKTKSIRIANVLFNDKYGLVTGGSFLASDNDYIISYFDPAMQIDFYKKIYDSSKNDELKFKQEILKTFGAAFEKTNFDFAKFKSIVQNSSIKLTKEEIQEINSINNNDNPVLILHKLTNF